MRLLSIARHRSKAVVLVACVVGISLGAFAGYLLDAAGLDLSPGMLLMIVVGSVVVSFLQWLYWRIWPKSFPSFNGGESHVTCQGSGIVRLRVRML